MHCTPHTSLTVGASVAVQANLAAALGGSAFALARLGLGALALPFDAAREHYARGVQAGLFPNSMLASRDVEVALNALEHLTLGPLARHV